MTQKRRFHVKCVKTFGCENEFYFSVQGSLHELSVTVIEEVQLPRPHVFQVTHILIRCQLQIAIINQYQGLQMLQQNALEKLAARDKFKESGVATLKLRFSKNLKSRQKTVDIALTSTGSDLGSAVAGLVGQTADKIKMIVSGRVVDGDQTLMEQGVRNSAVVMVILLADTEAIRIVEEQRRMLEQTRADAERLSGRDSNKDDYFLQVADQSGKSLDLPQEEKTSLIIAMSLHEKGRAALKK